MWPAMTTLPMRPSEPRFSYQATIQGPLGSCMDPSTTRSASMPASMPALSIVSSIGATPSGRTGLPSELAGPGRLAPVVGTSPTPVGRMPPNVAAGEAIATGVVSCPSARRGVAAQARARPASSDRRLSWRHCSAEVGDTVSTPWRLSGRNRRGGMSDRRTLLRCIRAPDLNRIAVLSSLRYCRSARPTNFTLLGGFVRGRHLCRGALASFPAGSEERQEVRDLIWVFLGLCPVDVDTQAGRGGDLNATVDHFD